MSELPEGWAACRLSDIGEIVTGKTPSTKEPRFYGGDIPFIKPGDLDYSSPIFRTETYLTADGAAEVPNLPSQSIVVTCIGNLGKVGLTTRTSATNQQINAVIPHEGINPTFMFHYCKTLKPWLEAESSATTISIVNKGIFSTAPVSLPPFAEQTRIAAKLDELLAQVDTLKARIDGIPALLKRFRQSVLAAAVSGRLTEAWRERADTANQPYSAGYSMATLDSLASFQNGFAFKSEWFSKEGDVQVAKIGNVRNGKADLSNSPAFVSRKIASEYERFMTSEGDILLSMTGTKYKRDYGFACSAPTGILVNQRVGKLTPDKDKVDSRFFLLCLQSAGFREQFFVGETGQVSQGNVGSEHIKKCLMPAPSLSEQTEIVRRVEQLFAFADQLEARVKAAQSRINHLTQSILAKAFRGELVPQDPNDEPASVLLERIKAQRAAAPKAKRGRRAATLS